MLLPDCSCWSVACALDWMLNCRSALAWDPSAADRCGVATEYGLLMVTVHKQWIGLRENLQESPIFNGKIYGFL